MNIEDITISLTDENGKVLIAYETYIRGQKQPIEPRMPVLRPCEIETVEELYIGFQKMKTFYLNGIVP